VPSLTRGQRERSKVVADNNARPRSGGAGHGGVSGEAHVRCDGEELDRMNGAAAGQARDICGGARAGVARPTRLPIQTIYFGSCYILSVVQRSVFAARLQKIFSPKMHFSVIFPPKCTSLLELVLAYILRIHTGLGPRACAHPYVFARSWRRYTQTHYSFLGEKKL
jgi:hypothetical protein